MIKAGIFFVVFFAASCGFTASQELIVSTPGFKPLHRGLTAVRHQPLPLLRRAWSYLETAGRRQNARRPCETTPSWPCFAFFQCS